MLSPGPGRPADFDCDKLLSALDERGLPAFGVCLGLQAMVEHAGGSLGLLDTPVHGKPGRVQVLGGELLAGLPAEFTAARYHSLHARPEQVTGGFEVTAVTPDGVVMAIEDAAHGRWGVQFHPESILTTAGGAGHQVIANVLRLCRDRRHTVCGASEGNLTPTSALPARRQVTYRGENLHRGYRIARLAALAIRSMFVAYSWADRRVYGRQGVTLFGACPTLAIRSASGSWPGYLAVPSASPGPWPAVVVIHEAFGLNDDIRRKADEFAAPRVPGAGAGPV